jgi:2-aminoadipate transaminase
MDRYAQCTQSMRRSLVRELLKLTARPGLISFAGGLPAADLFPLERFGEACTHVLHDVGRHPRLRHD